MLEGKEKRHWDFEVVIDGQYLNVNNIHPLKQLDVYYIVQKAKEDADIQSVVVFGSSVRFDCNSYSDIDILVVRSDERYISPVDYNKVQSDVDVVYSWKCGKGLKDEIEKTGVVVYRKET